jgi:predicted nucleic acid-binding protein
LQTEEYDELVSQIAYLDICCFKRPFDDAAVERIRREAEAVATILEKVQAGTFRLVRSPAHDFENERNPREDRRLATRLWLETATVSVVASGTANDRARALAALGFGPLDALHLAFAEAAAARGFVTTDDRLWKVATRNRAQLAVEVVMPDHVLFETEGEPA